jgi:hypothetical protein
MSVDCSCFSRVRAIHAERATPHPLLLLPLLLLQPNLYPDDTESLVRNLTIASANYSTEGYRLFEVGRAAEEGVVRAKWARETAWLAGGGGSSNSSSSCLHAALLPAVTALRFGCAQPHELLLSLLLNIALLSSLSLLLDIALPPAPAAAGVCPSAHPHSSRPQFDPQGSCPWPSTQDIWAGPALLCG